MNKFYEKLKNHAEHIKEVSAHCSTEETTKQALILPLLNIIGFNSFDPTKVKAEYGADFPGAKSGERVDYALFCHNVPVMFIEAKAYNQKLENHCPQLSRYFNATPEVTIAAITNGEEWRFFTDLEQKNVMDTKPFMTIDLSEVTENDAEQLYRFRHDQFQPDALRMLAEESIYLTAFTKAITESLKTVDNDFVKYVANRSTINRQLNQKFLESITPLVRKAVEKSVSEMVISGLSKPAEIIHVESNQVEIDPNAPVVDPNNPNIITTAKERKFLESVQFLLGSDAEIEAKDTVSYYNILYQGKVTRWIVRYHDKQKQTITLPIPITDEIIAEVERSGLSMSTAEQINIEAPENILRLAGIIRDCYEYCKNDENFRVKKKEGDAE